MCLSGNSSSKGVDAVTARKPFERGGSSPPPACPSFPIETYHGLEEATAERVRRFESETKAVMQRQNQSAKATEEMSCTTSGKRYFNSTVYKKPVSIIPPPPLYLCRNNHSNHIHLLLSLK